MARKKSLTFKGAALSTLPAQLIRAAIAAGLETIDTNTTRRELIEILRSLRQPRSPTQL